jgi:V/A-type H+-transporting ATPase subunit I
MDAVCDAGFRLFVLGGVPLCLINTDAGLTLMAVGALGIIFTGGRANSNIIMKLIGGLGGLYSCVTYLSDILSYSRLLGLGLATAVIAQVMNGMATIGGSTVGGWITCVLVFVVGHVFNVLINIIGTFVHSSRLQFIEFYGKFYEPGGRPFAPLFNKTKYVELIKEDV